MDTALKYIKHHDLDKEKWDQLIFRSNNALVFSYSWYLDAFCSWDIIVLGEYEGGIALPRRKKLMFSNLFQPNFIQKCNWIGQELTNDQIDAVQDLISNHFSLVHFNTNIDFYEKDKDRPNLILKLNDYDDIVSNYSKSLRKNLKRGNKDILITQEVNIRKTIELYQNAYGHLNSQLNDEDYENMIQLSESRPANFLNIQVYIDSSIAASLLFVVGCNRLHYILGAPNTLGRKNNALSFAIDDVIKKYSNGKMTLDFEGSSIPSVKKYYESFGAINEVFYEIEHQAALVKPLLWIYKRFKKS